jgi:phosphatidylserine decarboxylase
MVRDGIYYAVGFTAAGAIVSYIAGPWFGLPLYLVAAFCAYFFRDPDRLTPAGDFAVSPADGKIVAIVKENAKETRVSIFLNVFDVHVNRTPISGVISGISYQKGLFLVASRDDASVRNEQNTITVEGDGTRVIFKQIAGLIARRIVCDKKVGDVVQAGDRVGLIKFGSRVDVFFGPEWIVQAAAGSRVSAGESILARRADRAQVLSMEHAPLEVPLEAPFAVPLAVEEGLLCRT